MTSKKSLYPVYIDLSGKPVLVVGGGKIACRKLGPLLAAGADITVVSPAYDRRIGMLADRQLVKLVIQPFAERFLTGKWLVIAATDDSTVNRQVFELSERRGILCNVVDVPELCRFHVPAVVRRDLLQIAISTAGKSPALAKHLKKQIGEQFHSRYGVRIVALDTVRQRIKELYHGEENVQLRARLNVQAVSSPLLDKLEKGELSVEQFVSVLFTDR